MAVSRRLSCFPGIYSHEPQCPLLYGRNTSSASIPRPKARRHSTSCTFLLPSPKLCALAQQKLQENAPFHALQCGCECVSCTLEDGSISTDSNVCNAAALEVSCQEENKDNCGPQFSGKEPSPHVQVAIPCPSCQTTSCITNSSQTAFPRVHITSLLQGCAVLACGSSARFQALQATILHHMLLTRFLARPLPARGHPA